MKIKTLTMIMMMAMMIKKTATMMMMTKQSGLEMVLIQRAWSLRSATTTYKVTPAVSILPSYYIKVALALLSILPLYYTFNNLVQIGSRETLALYSVSIRESQHF